MLVVLLFGCSLLHGEWLDSVTMILPLTSAVREKAPKKESKRRLGALRCD